MRENIKVKFDDIIEDSNLPGPAHDQQEELRSICNTTGKTNFAKKIEELKIILNQNPGVNLKWFIHFLLIKRINATNLFVYFVDFIRQCGLRDAVSTTIA
jgi:hypothetical protein